jgi:hypothetical protein
MVQKITPFFAKIIFQYVFSKGRFLPKILVF